MLELRNVSYVVSDELGEKQILKNVNLSLDDRFVAFTGPNGGGKSTLAKVIAGIVKPTEGRIFFDGEDITDLSITERAQQGISYAPTGGCSFFGGSFGNGSRTQSPKQSCELFWGR